VTSDTAEGRIATSPRPQIVVLFVDDLEGIRELYARYLSFRGLRVTTAAEGVGALMAISDERPDAIVIDLAMPGMDGREAIEKIRGNPQISRIPIVVLSGQNARESALAAGADSYLEKPCAPEALLREVLRLLPPRRPSGEGVMNVEVDWQDGRPDDGATFERLVAEVLGSLVGRTFRGLVTVAIVRTAGRSANPRNPAEGVANWRCNGVTDERGDIDDGGVLEAVDDALLVFMNSQP
jgi:two-component system, cell cycle response regulator DivK